MKQPFVVTFAGVQGTSKSIVAHYLSERFGLPIFSTDNIRFEVREDLRSNTLNKPNVLAEYTKRRDERRGWLIDHKRSFIMDGSVDRTWQEFRHLLQKANFRWFIISMELSEAYIKDLYVETGRSKALEVLPRYLEQHQAFMEKYKDDVGMLITDETFPDRTKLAETALHAFLADIQ